LRCSRDSPLSDATTGRPHRSDGLFIAVDLRAFFTVLALVNVMRRSAIEEHPVNSWFRVALAPAEHLR